ncbi:hypothetical protein Tco_0213862 [Tanacetum coccineum]
MAKKEGKKKSTSKTDQSKKPATAKQPKPVSSKKSKPTTAKQPKPKPVKEKSTKPTPLQKADKGKVKKVQNVKSSIQLVDEPDEEQAQPKPEPEPQGTTHKLLTVEGKGKGIAINEQVVQSLLELQTPKKTSTTDQYIFQRRILVTEEASTGPSTQPKDDTSAYIVHDTSSPTDAETGAATDKMNSEGDTEILNIGKEQGEDVAEKVNIEEKTIEIDEGQAGSDPGKAPESRPPLNRVLMEEHQARPDPGQSHVAPAGPNPELMHEDFVATNLDNFNFSDQFFNDKPTEEDPGKTNMETKVKSMVTVPIHQASSLVPLLSIPVIDLTPPKPVSSTTHVSTFAVIIETTAITLPPPPPQPQSTADPALASRISALETVCANFEKRHKLQDKAVKEAVQVALQAPLRERFQDLSEADMKEILRDRMFESALEASMERDNRDAFLAEKDKSHKRRRDDQYPTPPPSKEPDQSKNKKHDSDASGSSKQKSASLSEQHVQDIPTPDDVHVSDTEDTDGAHLPKIKPRPDWLKPVLEEERSKTPEPDWVVPPNDLPEPENN